jgi:hypothetical protein
MTRSNSFFDENTQLPLCYANSFDRANTNDLERDCPFSERPQHSASGSD